MVIVGLTGSIGMGKTTVAAMFRERGIAVFDADAEVHRLYEGEAVPLVEKAFPGTTKEGRVDRTALAAALAKQPEGFRVLEAIVHPLVKRAETAFIRGEAKRDAAIAVLEIPLLFEAGLDAKVDRTLVVSAPEQVQRAGILDRAGMTVERLEMIHARQIPDGEKRRRADFVVDTGTSHAETEAAVSVIIARLIGETGTAFDRFWH
jgi:dephospho-CoA kinase